MLLRNTIYQTIRHSILTCEFKPGQDLREQDLAKQYRVSRSPIRDSLLRLERGNLITVLPRQGYQVRRISLADVEEISGFRLLIEPACVAVAARADDTMLRALDKFRGLANPDSTGLEFAEHDNAFHGAVIKLSGNMRMRAVAQDMIDQFGRLVMQSLECQAVRCCGAEHEAIIDALQAHDADRAAGLAFKHVKRLGESVTKALQLRDEMVGSARPPQ